MKEIIVVILVMGILYALSWALSMALFYLVCLCFSWEFNWLIATGIWLVLCIIKLIFGGKTKE